MWFVRVEWLSGRQVAGFFFGRGNGLRSGVENVRDVGKTRNRLLLAVFVDLEVVRGEISYRLPVFRNHGVNLNEVSGDLDYVVLIVGWLLRLLGSGRFNLSLGQDRKNDTKRQQ